MADYWKSQARKFCDFCKCWIADNKPSVEFHEGGKRHKENVAKKLSELAKRSAKQHKENTKLDAEMKKMEEEAMKAYMKDMEDEADYSSQQLKAVIDARKREQGEVIPPKKIKETFPEKKLWYEGKSDEGYTYYWHIETSESRWEPPEEGYLSLEEQQKAAEIQAKLAEAAQVEKNEEIRAWKQREEMKKFRKVEETVVTEKSDEEPVVVGPAPRANPYGSWTTVTRTVEKPIDLQLPQQDLVEVKVPSLFEPKIKIKEKRVTSFEEFNGPSTFKKRKPNQLKSNMRQRLDDDDD